MAQAVKSIAAALFRLVLTQCYDNFLARISLELAPSSKETLEGVFCA
jgi:hypothetical protein